MLIDVQLWIIVGILFFLFVIGLFFLISISDKQKQKRKALRPLEEKEQKNWKEVCLRMEHHVVVLRKESLTWQKRVRVLEREADVYKKKCDDLTEKLDRERGWQKKETQDVDTKNKRIQQLETELRAVEKKMEDEHAELIVLRRENTMIKGTAEKEAEEIRAIQLEMQKVQAQSDVYRKDILDLRADNKKLSQKHEDVQWIAKSVHLKVKEELRQKIQECEHLRNELIKKS